MIINNFIHLYLQKSPTPEEVALVLRIYGFRFVRKDSKKDPNEPVGVHWRWKKAHLSGKGFELVFYHRLFSDDKFYGKYNSFAMLSGNKESSDMDITAIDIFGGLLIDRYGGRIYNPEGETDDSYLCGARTLDLPTQVR